MTIQAPEGGLKVDSVVKLNQIRTVDKKRLYKHLGTVTAETMAQVENAILISLGIVST